MVWMARPGAHWVMRWVVTVVVVELLVVVEAAAEVEAISTKVVVTMGSVFRAVASKAPEKEGEEEVDVAEAVDAEAARVEGGVAEAKVMAEALEWQVHPM